MVFRFRFGLGANIGQGTPYYPFAFSRESGFAVAVESLATVAAIWKKYKCLKKVSGVLLDELTILQERMELIADKIGVPFLGLDWSLAPLPNTEMSVCAGN